MQGLKGMLWTVGLVFGVAFITQIVSTGPLDLWNTTAATWQAAVNSGVAALIALGINAASPWVTRYGVGSE